MIAEGAARWEGELLWPEPDLPDAEIIDLGAVKALGSWVHGWFRVRGQRCVVGASLAIRRQLQAADLPILWYGSVTEAHKRHRGVTRTEQEMLWE